MVYLISLIMLGHGLLHLIGMIQAAGLARFPEITGATVIDLSPRVRSGFAFVWLAAAMLLCLAAVGAASGVIWWRPLAIAGVLVSQPLIALWWSDAHLGTIANLIIITAVVLL